MKTFDKNNFYMAILVSILILFSHLGINELLSFQFFSFIISILIFKNYIVKNILYLTTIGVIYFLILSVGYYFADHELNTYLRACRAALVAAILFTIENSISLKKNKLFFDFYAGVYIACVFSISVALLQLLDSIFWSKGYFDVPVNWYSIEYGTLFSESRDSLYGTGYFIRPSGFFSEPSALVALGILGLFCAHVGDNYYKLPMYKNISIALMIVPFSINGFIILPLAMFFYGEKNEYKKTAAYYIGFFIIALGLYFVNETFRGRVNSIFDGNDISASIRFSEPVRVIYKIFEDGILLGVSQDIAISYASSEIYSIFNNWLFNQIIFYGLFGVALIFLPFYMINKKIWLIVFSYMILNGELFYYDRFFMILCAIIVNNFFDEIKK